MFQFRKKTPKFCLHCGLILGLVYIDSATNPELTYVYWACPEFKNFGSDYASHYHKVVNQVPKLAKFDPQTGARLYGKNSIRGEKQSG